MEQHGSFRNRRRLMLVTVGALLIVVGLVSAISAPAGPPRSNKADAYGGPIAPKPNNPKSVAACNTYYGPSNPGTEAAQCRATAQKNIGLARCAKKKGAARTACRRAVNKKYAKTVAKLKKQAAAEAACRTKYNQAVSGADPDAPDYDSKLQTASEEYNTCLKNAQGG